MITGYSNTISVTTSAPSLLLDLYPSAAAAYSVRKLRAAYTGSAIRVRRSSDNAEQNIGFVNGNLDTTALTSFCSGTNGFVTTWYDQSGNGVNVTQTTANNQPQIVSGGSVLLVNGKPAILSVNNLGTTNCLRNSSFTTYTPLSDFYAFKYNSFISGTPYQTAYDGGAAETQRGYFGYEQSSNKMITYEGIVLQGYTATLSQTLATNIRNGAISQMYKNNALQITGNAGINNTIIGLTFGCDYVPTSAGNVYHQEFIRYSGVSSNISSINTNINTYYGIY